jgi:hypothetical protein
VVPSPVLNIVMTAALVNHVSDLVWETTFFARFGPMLLADKEK